MGKEKPARYVLAVPERMEEVFVEASVSFLLEMVGVVAWEGDFGEVDEQKVSERLEARRCSEGLEGQMGLGGLEGLQYETWRGGLTVTSGR